MVHTNAHPRARKYFRVQPAGSLVQSRLQTHCKYEHSTGSTRGQSTKGAGWHASQVRDHAPERTVAS